MTGASRSVPDAMEPSAGQRNRAAALMILGTASHVGKSVVTTAFCRLLAERGYRVAPFKAQNMALNSFVTREGGEIGRAQVAQAEAAGIEPHVDMNPVLLKPAGGVSQVILEGSPIGVMSARDYYAVKNDIWPRVSAAYDRLARRFDFLILEGAGSPVEVNLSEHDLTNLRMARHADASIVLVADIERGGVFAQIVGTWELLDDESRRRVVGFVINKFRGDVSLLDTGLDFLRSRTGVPVLGVLPYRTDLGIDQEDSLGIAETATPKGFGERPGLDVAVIQLPHLSNATDFRPLSRAPGTRLRYVTEVRELGSPDLIILPGTKATVLDLDWLRENGLADAIISLAGVPNGPLVMGVCGGYQMLGRVVEDPLGVESDRPRVDGLGLIAMATRFGAEKNRHRVKGRDLHGDTYVVGYEIHMGETTLDPGLTPWFELTRERDNITVLDGTADPSGRLYGTYVHGLFDSTSFLADLVGRLRLRRGLPPLDATSWERHRSDLADRYGPLAALLRENVDLDPVWRALGLPTEGRS